MEKSSSQWGWSVFYVKLFPEFFLLIRLKKKFCGASFVFFGQLLSSLFETGSKIIGKKLSGQIAEVLREERLVWFSVHVVYLKARKLGVKNFSQFFKLFSRAL